ncbi:conserved hypothetical protein [Paraburkholderia tropica]|uniref:hypothetical protein n=1 Tax=Paraburkholderia tropica TaxID=92647 RepID=UPI001CAE80D8|nr:hypothetical protein [Paraburkholderia tropica]CAG9229889.1 conserved hypothetical protein [Paraburkholderia tropica]
MTNSKEKGGEFPKFTETAAGRTKTGRLRDLFDEIEQAKLAGWRYEKILMGLEAQGLAVSMNTLKDALKRIRAERRAHPVPQEQTQPAPKKESVQASGETADKSVSGSVATSGGKISNSGYREAVQTFTRDVNKRTNLDE